MTGERRDDEEKERKGASHDQICLHGSNGWMNVITLDKSLACLVFACQSQLRPSRLVRTCAAERPPAGIIIRKTIPGDAKLVSVCGWNWNGWVFGNRVVFPLERPATGNRQDNGGPTAYVCMYVRIKIQAPGPDHHH